MSKIIYKYKNKTYGENDKKSARASGMPGTVLFLVITVVVLTVVCISLNLIINRSSAANVEISGTYNANSVYEPLSSGPASTSGSSTDNGDQSSSLPSVQYPDVLKPYGDDRTVALGSLVTSEYAIVVDCNTGHIVASKNSQKKVYPASLTKVMSAIVAYEYMLANDVDIMSTYLTISQEIIDYTYKEGASNANFQKGELVRIHDVFNGLILPSGADATLMLAEFCYGSEKEFVNMMNNKSAELGLENTHFVTSTGLHDKEHYSTVSDFAVILDYACKYDYLRELMQLTSYRYPVTNVQAERSTVSTLYNWRTRYSSTLSKSLPAGVTKFGGKSGYTPEAKCCLCTFAFDDNGNRYIVVTCSANSGKIAVTDYLAIYNRYCKFGS